LAGHVARMGKIKISYDILICKPEGRRQPAKTRHRWNDNITNDFEEVLHEDANWHNLSYYRGRWWASGLHKPGNIL